MKNETTRRAFLNGGSLTTACLLAGTRAQGAQQEVDTHQDHGVHGRDHARDRPSVGGPVGGAPPAAGGSCRASARPPTFSIHHLTLPWTTPLTRMVRAGITIPEGMVVLSM
jgi:hypothetical protein